MLIKVGLKNRLDNFPSQISGGEQQRVSIARAMAKNPQIVLCDEPTGALDSATGQMVLKLICDAAHSMGKTVIIVTHNVLIADMADTVIHMKDGKIFEIKQNMSPKAAEDIVW
jgi:putative ABC transport system ATP-binding protein